MADYIDELYAKSPEWHARRRKTIGASDANIIVGGSDEAVIQLWAEKCGLREPEDLSDKIPVLMGCLTEPLNIAIFERRTGLSVTKRGESAVSATVPFMSVTLDGYVASENALVEAKHCGSFRGWDDIVTGYYPQTQHAMSVIGADCTYLSVLLGNSDWRYEKIAFDPFYLESLVAAESKFWECVQSGEPPRALPPIPVQPGEAHRIVDMSQNNRFVSAAVDWKENKAAAKKFTNAAEAMKDLVETDVREAYASGVRIKRDRRGFLRIGED